jgi:hypothetical protein
LANSAFTNFVSLSSQANKNNKQTTEIMFFMVVFLNPIVFV